jgi:general secretion pathway protein A
MNVICDRALLGAYSRESRTVNKRLVRRAATEVSGQPLPPAFMKLVVPVISVIGIMVIGAAMWAMFDRESSSTDSMVSVTLPAGTEVAALISEPATANPQPAKVAEQPGLDEHLVQLNEDAKSEPGILTLLSLWGIDYNPAAGTACAQAEAQGYSCYYQRGSLNGIRQLDRPGVLTLTDSQGRTHEPVLVSLNKDVAELSFGGDHVSFPVDEVADIWFGQFLLIWRPPGGTTLAISPGMQNESVRWLRQSLAALDSDYQPQAADSDFFDEGLQQQLTAFQRQHRLEADGLAGQKTQIIINSLLAQDGTPRLTSTR